MDSTMMYLHVKKTGNESVDPVKNLHCLFVCLFAIILSTFRLFKGQQYLNNMLRVNK